VRGRFLLGHAAGVGAALLATLAVAFAAEPVAREPDTGFVLKQKLELLDKATDLTDRFVAVRAVGYLDGIADAAVGLGYTCYPTGVTQAQLREVVMNYLRDHPERLNDPAPLLVLNGLFEAFPCKQPEAHTRQ
jgi:hypothetical protein